MPDARDAPNASRPDRRPPPPRKFDLAWERRSYTASSPAEKVFVSMRGDTDLTVSFMPGWYARASVPELEAELSRAARLTFVERTRAYYALRSELVGHPVVPATTVHSDEQARWRRGLEELAAHGQSADGTVTMTMIGTTQYAVTVAPSALSLAEEQFAAACREAGLACLADHNQGWQRLHFEIYTLPRLQKAGVAPR